MKRTIGILMALLLSTMSLRAYDFEALSPSGHTLYYDTVDGEAHLVHPNTATTLFLSYIAGELVIPSTVTFDGVTYTVTAIDATGSSGNIGCFTDCSLMTQVNIPSTIKYIGAKAFNNCPLLGTVTIPSSVDSIGTDAFYHVRHIVYNGSAKGSPWGALCLNGVRVGDLLFQDSSMTVLAGYLGTGDSLAIPDSVKCINDYAFYGCNTLRKVSIPSTVDSIGTYAFALCTGITSLHIPVKISKIGYNAFSLVNHIVYNGELTGAPWGAIHMNNLIYGDFVVIDTSSTTLAAYIGTDSIITVPDYITAIGDSAFYSLNNVSHIVLPKTLTKIGIRAFHSLKIKSITFPDSLKSVGFRAFSYCRNLDTIHYNAVNCTYMGTSATSGMSSFVFYECNNLKNIIIGDSVRHIAAGAFAGIAYLKNVVFNSDVCTSMGIPSRPAFGGSGLHTTLTIDNKVKSIPPMAFTSFYGLENINWSTSLTTIGDSAFKLCTALEKVSFGNSLTTIGAKAFYGCSSLTELTLGNSVQTIGDGAFSLTKLQNVSFPSSVVYIGNSAFAGCKNLIYITFNDNYADIGDRCFNGCSNLESVEFGDNIKSIGSYAFYQCGKITNLVLPKSLKVIESFTFSFMSNLLTVEMGDSVTIIKQDAFCNNYSLAEISFSKLLETISTAAFIGCYKLKKVCLPSSVKTIEDFAFDNIESVELNSDIPPTLLCSLGYESGTHFGNVNIPGIPNPTIYVPCDSYDNYTVDVSPAWEYYKDVIQEGSPKFEITVASEDTVKGNAIVLERGGGYYVRCDSIAMVRAVPNDNYRFVAWSDGNTTNPYSMYLVGDTSLIAYFDRAEYTIEVKNANSFMGHCGGGGTYLFGDTITIYAEAYEGYRFKWWQDGDTHTHRQIIVVEDTLYTAYFTIDQTGIDNIEQESPLQIQVSGLTINVTVADGQSHQIHLYDVAGHLMQSTTLGGGEIYNFTLPSAGVYLLKPDNYPARRIVAIDK